jgi:hypothetical protein
MDSINNSLKFGQNYAQKLNPSSPLALTESAFFDHFLHFAKIKADLQGSSCLRAPRTFAPTHNK